MSRFAIRILSSALLICSGALLSGTGHFAKYLSNDSEEIARLERDLSSPHANWNASVPSFREALQRDPASAERWCQLGEAIGRTGDLPTAEYCYRRGATLGPREPKILLDLGDFYFKARLYRKSLPWFSGLLKAIPDTRDVYVSNTFEYYDAMDVMGNGWLDEAIPNGEVARAYLAHLIENKDGGTVAGLWQWADQRGFTNDDIAVQYTDYLMRERQSEVAAQIWAKHFRGRGYECAGSSCVFNGGFEHPFTGGSFDWHLPDPSVAAAERDQASRYEGQYSLRIEFTADNNPDFRQVSEVVPIQPGRYRLDGYIRTAGITSDEGIRLRISGSNSLRAETNAISGTEPWQRVTTEFTALAGVRDVEVQVARRRSVRIDNQLSGTAWIDSVRLTRLR